MTTSEQSTNTLKHPSFKQAIKNYNLGYEDDIHYILTILQIEADNRRKEDSIRLVGQYHSLNKADLKEYMRQRERPNTMDCRLPHIKPVEESTLLQKIHSKAKSAQKTIANQLNLFINELKQTA